MNQSKHRNRVLAPAFVGAVFGAILMQVTVLHAEGAGAPDHASYVFDTTGQTLTQALKNYAQTTKQQIIFTEDLVAGRQAPVIKGEFTAEAALVRLLDRSGLTVERSPSGALMIKRPESNSRADASSAFRLVHDASEDSDRHSPLRFADADGSVQDTREQPKSSSSTSDEVVVTGSHIRGAQTKASPIMVFGREEIQRTGFSSTQQFIQSLPQNFRGGSSEDTIGGLLGGEGSNLNYGRASGANLRGLGNKATLTLLNGRRVTSVGVGEAVDLSMIPLAAIERIDVLTDGASAIYGSDAVSGVINIVLRESFSGAETSLRYGDVTDGSNAEYKVGQTFGGSWNSGSGLVAYEFAKRDPLSAADRAFTRDGGLVGVEIVPPNEQHSAVASLTQRVNDRTELFAEGIFSTRDTESTYISSGRRIRTPVSVDQYRGGLSARFDLSKGWQTDIGASLADNRMRNSEFDDEVLSSVVDMESSTLSFDAKADGAVFSAPGGQARLAVGGQYREETFHSRGTSFNTGGQDSRTVSAVFAELLVPLLGGSQKLELSLAGRYEEYSDFGSTANPKVGLAWSPVAGLNLRSTYGTSFRAPSFYELSTAALPVRPILFPIRDPQSTTPAGTTYVLVLSGNTGVLRPEEAKSWTAGLDYRPESLPGMSLALTYFNIDFTDRIGEPLSNGFFDMLVNEAQHPDFIQRNPPASLVNAYMAYPRFLNLTGLPLTAANVGAIADNRGVNVSMVEENGLDFSLGYDFARGADHFAVQMSGTYLLDKYNRVTAESPVVATFNAVFQPVDLRLRNSLNWSRGALGASLFINYADKYRDVRPGRQSTIASWTTVDMTVRRQFTERQSWLKGVTLSLAALNVLDKDPPYINNGGFNFDATNANGVGRYLSLGVTKQW